MPKTVFKYGFGDQMGAREADFKILCLHFKEAIEKLRPLKQE
jgi:hypothetical protein